MIDLPAGTVEIESSQGFHWRIYIKIKLYICFIRFTIENEANTESSIDAQHITLALPRTNITAQDTT